MGFGVKSIDSLQKKADTTKQESVKNMMQITREQLVNLFVTYKIPVAKETVKAIQRYSAFYVKK